MWGKSRRRVVVDEVEVEVKIGVRVRVASGWVGLGSLAVVEVEGEDAYEFIWSSGGRQWVGMRMEGFWGGFAGFRLDFSKHKKKQANDRSQRGLPWGGGRLLKSAGELLGDSDRAESVWMMMYLQDRKRGETWVFGGAAALNSGHACLGLLGACLGCADPKGILPHWEGSQPRTSPCRPPCAGAPQPRDLQTHSSTG